MNTSLLSPIASAEDSLFSKSDFSDFVLGLATVNGDSLTGSNITLDILEELDSKLSRWKVYKENFHITILITPTFHTITVTAMAFLCDVALSTLQKLTLLTQSKEQYCNNVSMLLI